ncbi:hypothetical protein D3C73_781890 [compost metagenome]
MVFTNSALNSPIDMSDFLLNRIVNSALSPFCFNSSAMTCSFTTMVVVTIEPCVEVVSKPAFSAFPLTNTSTVESGGTKPPPPPPPMTGTIFLKVVEKISLLFLPSTTVMALIVVVSLNEIAFVYNGEFSDGSLPSRV